MTRLQRAQMKQLASTEVKNISERIMHAQQRVCLEMQKDVCIVATSLADLYSQGILA